ncbi:MAG TPA: hypothetical protein VLL25_02815, partial [Acidimicrobiales bacterium]|nr:hypothetical protein [Acidimicrobiales bacterium]
MRTLALLAALLTALVAVVLTALPADPTAADNALDQARLAAEVTPFQGIVSVQWQDSFGLHRETLTVKDTSGAIQIEGQGSAAMVATANERLVLDAGGWSLVAPGSPTAYGPEPPITSKYHVTTTTGSPVAGRQTTLIDIRTADGSSEERLFVDQGTGLLLRREQQEGGRTVRVVTFDSIQIGPVAGLRTPPVHRDELPRQIRPNALPAPYRAPPTLATGYQRVGILRRQAVVQVEYSDGLHSLSVFEQTGELDVGRLPRPADQVTIGSAQALR